MKHAITEEEALKYTKIKYGSKCLKRSKASNCFNSSTMKTKRIVRFANNQFAFFTLKHYSKYKIYSDNGYLSIVAEGP